MSKALGPNDKYFKSIRLTTLSENENVTILNDNSFAYLTFDNFYGYGINSLSIFFIEQNSIYDQIFLVFIL